MRKEIARKLITPGLPQTLSLMAFFMSWTFSAYAAPNSIRPSQPAQIAQNRPQSRPRIQLSSEEDRTLAGHMFLRNNLIDFPFVAPYINSSLESALTTLSVPGADSDIKTVGLSPSVTGQLKFDRVGIELGAQLSELFGADSYSAYVVGATFDYALSAGIRYAAVRERNYVITPALFYSYDTGLGFSPLSAADASIDSPAQARVSNLLTRTTLQQIRPTLLGAYAISPVVGLTGELGLSFQQDKNGDENQSSKLLRLGLGADANFIKFHVPAGLGVFFRDDLSLGSSRGPSPIIGAGVYEMFHRNFNFGMEFSKLLTSTPTLSILLTLTAYY